jgi:group I intron endonuclease
MNCGVYQIRNLINNKIYIGSAKNLNQRWNKFHKKQLHQNIHYNLYLQHAWNKYGKDKFVFEVKEYCSEDILIGREQWWIENTPCMYYQNGYNICPIAGNTLGRICNEETKLKISQANKGRKPSEETKKKLSNLLKGKNNPFYGRHHTQETKEQISKKKIGVCSGENNPKAKLTWDKVNKIRSLFNKNKKTITELSKFYEVHYSTIVKIVGNKIWNK